MISNDQWLAIIRELLRGSERTRRRAREVLWLEIFRYVVHRAKLPIGPLANDPDERREIALRVLQKLERNNYAHLREWEHRQCQRRNAAPWWGFVKVVAIHRAIEHARTSRLNLARRGEPFVWAIIEPIGYLSC